MNFLQVWLKEYVAWKALKGKFGAACSYLENVDKKILFKKKEIKFSLVCIL